MAAVALFQTLILVCYLITNVIISSNSFENDGTYQEAKYFKNSTVVIAILVRNKAHTLPYFLSCLERLDYPKDRIILWIQSDHNEDGSVEIIERWLTAWAGAYHLVHKDIKQSPPYRLPEELGPAHWPLERYSHMIKLREKALEFSRKIWAEYIWMLDCDVFITRPGTLYRLINKNHIVTAPMLRSDGLYSNFWCGMTDEFYYARTQEYEPILNRQRTGCFAVPMVHSSVLVDLRIIATDKLHYDPKFVQGYTGPHDDIITFALSANLSGVPMFVCNDQLYGYVTVPMDKEDALSYDSLQLTNVKMEVLLEGESLTASELLAPYTSVPQRNTISMDRVFMINLVRRPERRQRMEHCFTELGLDVTIVDAVDGKDLTDDILSDLGVTLMEGYVDPYHKRPMKKGEVGCVLSHYTIWEKVVESGDQVVMVLEDDVRFESFFRHKVEALLAELDTLDLEWDFIYLGRKRLLEKEEEAVPGSKLLVRPNYSYWSLGYLLSQSGARKLLDSRPLDNLLPVDEFLPILYDKHTEEKWKGQFPVRDLQAFSAEPLLIYPAKYLNEEGYVSDTEDSTLAVPPREEL